VEFLRDSGWSRIHPSNRGSSDCVCSEAGDEGLGRDVMGWEPPKQRIRVGGGRACQLMHTSCSLCSERSFPGDFLNSILDKRPCRRLYNPNLDGASSHGQLIVARTSQ
jgi:hypothetical protein